MPETVLKKKQQQHGNLLLRRGVSLPARRSSVGVGYRSFEQGAPLTPVPTWKLYENPSYQSLAMPVAPSAGLMDGEDDDEENNSEEEEEEEEKKIWVQRDDRKDADPKDTAAGSASGSSFLCARNFAVSLCGELQEDGQGDSHSTICDFSESSPRSHFQKRPSSLSTSESPDSVQHHGSSKAPTTSQQISRSALPLPSLSPPLKAITFMPQSAAGINLQLQSSTSKESNCCRISSSSEDAMEELGEVLNKYENANIASSCDYSKPSSSQVQKRTQVDATSVESSFAEELKRALCKVQQVEAAQISARKEVDGLLRRYADEILILRSKEQEQIQAAVLSVAEQLDKETKAKRNAEMENRRLARSLADANQAVLEAKEEVAKEKRARQLMEDVCDELAKEIGEDKAEAEELKRELAKVRGEIEEERKALQVTEAWREERVQMKLLEAKLELEERCLALDKLKSELELFLKQGKAHRVDTFLDHGGKALRAAVKKLQEETSKSAFFLKDSRGFFSLGYDASVSSDITCSWKSSRGSNEDRSIMHVNAYDSSGIQQTLQSVEHGQKELCWNVEPNRLARKEYNRLVSPSMHLDEHDKQWISSIQASRRCARGMESYGSKTRGLNTLGDQGLRNSFNNFEYRTGAGSAGSRSGGDCSSESDSSNEEQGSWSADFDNVNAHLRQRDLALRSATEVEERCEWGSSPKFSRKVTDRFLENVEDCHGAVRVERRRHGAKGRKAMNRSLEKVHHRHGAVRVEQRHHGAKGYMRAGQPCVGDTYSKAVFSLASVRLSEDDNGFSSLTGCSPACKARMRSPDLLSQKGRNWNECSASSGRKSVYTSVDWSNHPTRHSEDDNGFSSLSGYSPAYKAHMPSPDLSAQKGTSIVERNEYPGRKAVYTFVDWSKPYKKNSLQAKLLLEDSLHEGKFKLGL